jgi:hypothetical protein
MTAKLTSEQRSRQRHTDARPGRLLVADIRAGRCRSGHDLAGEPGTVNVSGRSFCVACRILAGGKPRLPRANNGLCASGRHPYTGGGRCAPCNRLRDAEARQRRAEEAAAELATAKAPVPKYLIRGLPSTEILDGAICTPAQAKLFEPISRADSDYGQVETLAEAKARQAVAIAICQRCPVRALCEADGLRYTREGVYGGVSMSYRFHRVLKVKAQLGACTPVDTRVQSAS